MVCLESAATSKLEKKKKLDAFLTDVLVSAASDETRRRSDTGLVAEPVAPGTGDDLVDSFNVIKTIRTENHRES